MVFESNIKEFNHYLFACGELAEREREFLDKQLMDRLIMSESKEDFYKILNETYYNIYIEEARKSGNLESLIKSEEHKSIEYLQANLAEEHKNLIMFLILDTELHNVKVVLKSEILKKDLKDLFVHYTCSFDDLKNAYETKDFSKIAPDTAEILSYATELMQSGFDFRMTELKLEQFFFKKLSFYVAGAKSEMLQEMLKHRIDMMNIKNVYRSKIAKEDFLYEDFLYEGGLLDIEFFKHFEGESLDYFAQTLEKSEYVKMIMQGMHLLYTEQTFASFEKNEEEFVLSFFDQARYSVSSLEKVLGFFVRKRFESRSLNIIFTGVANNIGREKIRHRIPNL